MVPAGSLVAKADFLAAQVRRQLRRRRLPAALPAAARQAAPACRRLRRRVAAVAGRAAGGADRPRRTQASAIVVRIHDAGTGNATVVAIRIGRLRRTGGTVRIDHRRRAGGTAVTRIIGRESGPWASVRRGPNKRGTGRTAIARVIGRKNRARGHRRAAVRINRSTGRTAIARIGRRQHRAGRRQRGRTLRVRRIVIVVQCVEIGCAGAAAFIDHIAT